MPDGPISLTKGTYSLTKLGATLSLKGQESYPHHQMLLTEKKQKVQIKPITEIKDSTDPEIENTEILGLTKNKLKP